MESRHHTGVPEEELDKIDLISMISGLRKPFCRTWWILLLLLLLGGLAGAFRAYRGYHPQYEASATYAVSSGQQDNVIYSYNNLISTEQLSATFPYIMTSGVLQRVVAEDMGLPVIPGKISARMIGQTNLFQISVTASDPQIAYDTLQSVMENYPKIARYVIGNTKLKLMLESGVPKNPVNSRNYKRSILLGIFVMGILYMGMLCLWSLFRRTIKSRDDIQKYMNINWLGGLPEVRQKRRSRKKELQILADDDHLPDYQEAMETIEIRLQRKLEEEHKNTLLVTSAAAGEGKTTTACNLAITMALKGRRVLLLDCDLRNPSVYRCLGAENLHIPHVKSDKPGQNPGPENGMCDVLKGDRTPEEVMLQYKDTSLLVLPGREIQENVSPLYVNGKLREVIQQMKTQADYIIVDTPPCSFMHDATLVSECVEMGVIVIGCDYAHVGRIRNGVEILTQAELPLAGCILNREYTGIGSYGYGKYGYGKYGYGRYGYGRYGYKGYGYGEKE